LDGTQPTFTHVPPIVVRSTITTLAPRSRARIAAANAPAPDPITIRSYSSSPITVDCSVVTYAPILISDIVHMEIA